MTVYPLWLSLSELEAVEKALPDNGKVAALRSFVQLNEEAEKKLDEYLQLTSDDEKIGIE